jgi:magnesium-transporting ATPase (P-type)
MWCEEKLKAFDDQINDYNKKNNEIQEKLINLSGTRKDYMKSVFISIIMSALFLYFSYFVQERAVSYYNDIINGIGENYSRMEYISALFISFAASFSASFCLFMYPKFPLKKEKGYKEIINLIKDIFGIAIFSFLFCFVCAFFFILSFIFFSSFFNFVPSFQHNLILFLLSTPFAFRYIKEQFKNYFKNKKDQEKYISDLERKKEELKIVSAKNNTLSKDDFINSIKTIDDYNFLKITCENMEFIHIKDLYDKIEQNLLKNTEFKDFKTFEESIIKNRANLNVIENI